VFVISQNRRQQTMPLDTDHPLFASLFRTLGFALFLLVVGAGSSSFAQGIIEGTVVERGSEDPLPNVNVTIPELGLGAATNVEGEYQVEDVPPGEHVVRARFVGFQTREQRVTVQDGQTTTLDFMLRPSNMEMDEVVVTGQGGDAQRREIGNSISSLDGADIEDAASQSLGDLLQGRSSGTTVMANSGQVGTARSIRLRGNNSVTQGNRPLIYVDGVRMNNQTLSGDSENNQGMSSFDDINPNDIERIEVIKGLAATTLYGTEASAGVIQVFTKAGSQGAPRFSFSTQQGANHLSQIGNQDFHSELDANTGDFLRTGHTQRYNLSVRGGTGDLNYYTSAQFGREEGVIDPQGSQDYGLRANFQYTPLDDLSIKVNNSYTRRDVTWIPSGNNAEGFLLNSIRGDAGYTPDGDHSVVFDMDLNTLTDHFTSGLNLNWTPTSSMNHSFQIGLDYVSSEYKEERPFQFFFEPLGDRENQTEVNSELTFEYTGSYDTEIGENFSSNTTIGGQIFRDQFTSLNGFGYEFAGPGEKVLDSAARTEAFETQLTEVSGGFFGQQRFGWADRAFLTLGLRVDGHNTFGDDFGLAPYPKASFSYLVSEHSFWPDWWDSLKLRSAYGESGQAPGAFDAIRTYESVSGDEGQPGLTPGNIGDPDLGPERSRELEVGFEGSAFEDRIGGEFTWYYQRTYDGLLSVQPTPSEGFTQSQLRNVGEFRTKGIEAELNLDVLRRQTVDWSVGGGLSTNFSKVLDTGDAGDIYLGWRNEAREGFPLPSFFHDRAVNPDEIPEDPTDIEMEEQFIGPTYPTHTMNLNTSVTLWDDLSMEVVGEGQFGHVLSSGTAYQNVRRGEWPTCNDIQAQIDQGDYSGLTAGEIANCDPVQTTYGQWTRSADFFKIRSASISYRLPADWLPSGVRNALLKFEGRNLLTITDYPGLDPEAFEDGARDFAIYRQEYYNMPPLRSFTFTFRTSF
jgi:outer membrane receptor protein involved in Fe transport